MGWGWPWANINCGCCVSVPPPPTCFCGSDVTYYVDFDSITNGTCTTCDTDWTSFGGSCVDGKANLNGYHCLNYTQASCGGFADLGCNREASSPDYEVCGPFIHGVGSSFPAGPELRLYQGDGFNGTSKLYVYLDLYLPSTNSYGLDTLELAVRWKTLRSNASCSLINSLSLDTSIETPGLYDRCSWPGTVAVSATSPLCDGLFLKTYFKVTVAGVTGTECPSANCGTLLNTTFCLSGRSDCFQWGDLVRFPCGGASGGRDYEITLGWNSSTNTWTLSFGHLTSNGSGRADGPIYTGTLDCVGSEAVFNLDASTQPPVPFCQFPSTVTVQAVDSCTPPTTTTTTSTSTSTSTTTSTTTTTTTSTTTTSTSTSTTTTTTTTSTTTTTTTTPVPACGCNVPSTLRADVISSGPNCSCAVGDVFYINFSGGGSTTWQGSWTPSCTNGQALVITVRCTGGSWFLDVDNQGGSTCLTSPTHNNAATSSSCGPPFTVTFSTIVIRDCCSGATANNTVSITFSDNP